mmetsp:Transcript_1221/g.1951  ORF Transcript_1221/g.1951 Transcript_1221/m.1951 type:complete len:83 (-) Transcript_1221:427-675(-)
MAAITTKGAIKAAWIRKVHLHPSALEVPAPKTTPKGAPSGEDEIESQRLFLSEGALSSMHGEARLIKDASPTPVKALAVNSK